MILASLNKPKQLLLLSYIGEVKSDDFVRARGDLISFLNEMSPGFRLLTDLSDVDLIHEDALPQISEAMDLCHEHGVGIIVRVIPDPAKDIGMNILSAFHYPQGQRIVTCASMLEAAKALGL